MRRSPRQTVQATDPQTPWWSQAVFYQVYVRSFCDSDGDGLGDLDGITSQLGYLELLGVDALWLTPFFRSPMADHGYDVADPRSVDPRFGDLDAFDRLLERAHSHGIRVTIDIVPNHSSDQHHWFQEALRSAAGSAARQRYIFRDGRGSTGELPPNDWPSIFGGPAWTRLPDGQWYLHLFTPQQPDFNWDNAEVREDLQHTLRFWMDRGVDGFRIDVAHGMAKPAGLPDLAPGAAPEAGTNSPQPVDPRFDDDGVHEIHRLIRSTIEEYPERMSVGEVWVADPERYRRYLRPDELHLGFNFSLVQAEYGAKQAGAAIEETMAGAQVVSATPTWTLANHDVQRQVTRYGGGRVGLRRARAMALVELGLPGAIYLYAGEELGLPNVEDLPEWALQDPIWERSQHTVRGRDGCRVPIPWSGDRPPFGFTDAPASWLPIPTSWRGLTVEAQLERQDSTLSLYRSAIELRQQHECFRGTGIEWFSAPEGCLAYRRREGGLVCAFNTGPEQVPLPPGELLLASDELAADPAEGPMLPPDTAAWLRQS